MGIGRSRNGDPPRRAGIFGGTFDPVHVGHLAVADAVRSAVPLDTVLFAPAAHPRLRAAAPAASIDDRVAMVRLAIGGLPWARLSLVDAVRPGPAYSIDTVKEVRREEGEATQLYLIVGADALATLPKWKDAGGLGETATLVVIGRPGLEGPDRPASLPEGHPAKEALYVEGPMIEVSATEIRRLVGSGKPVAGIVPDAVAAYIEQHGLYR